MLHQKMRNWGRKVSQQAGGKGEVDEERSSGEHCSLVGKVILFSLLGKRMDGRVR